MPACERTKRAAAGPEPASAVEAIVDSLNASGYDNPMVPTPEVGQIFLDTLYPTYRGHCWWDTGRNEHIDGRRYCLLAVLGSFGYHLIGDDLPAGWTHRLRGAIRLDERFYVLQVANGGVARSERLNRRCNAYCRMTNHCHVVVEPPCAEPVLRVWAR
jgi:hypothetical protein